MQNKRIIIPSIIILSMLFGRYVFGWITRPLLDLVPNSSWRVFYEFYNIIGLLILLVGPALLYYYFKRHQGIRDFAIALIIYEVVYRLVNSLINWFNLYEGFAYAAVLVIEGTFGIFVLITMFKMFKKIEINKYVKYIAIGLYSFRHMLFNGVMFYVLRRISEAMENEVFISILYNHYTAIVYSLVPLIIPVLFYFLYEEEEEEEENMTAEITQPLNEVME